MNELIFYAVTVLVPLIISYLVYIHKSLKEVDARLDNRYSKRETEHMIDLKLQPINDRTIMLEDRLERLERKIDRILEAVHGR